MNKQVTIHIPSGPKTALPNEKEKLCKMTQVEKPAAVKCFELRQKAARELLKKIEQQKRDKELLRVATKL